MSYILLEVILNMTNRRRFFYNGILLTIVGLAVKSVGLIFSAFLGRTIGAEALGLYTLIGTVYSFAITFASAGISLTVTRLVAAAVGEGREKEVASVVRSAAVYSLAFSGAASVVLFSFSGYISSSVLEDVRAALPLRILSASLIPIALSAVFSGYFIGVKRIKRSSSLQIMSQFFKVGITVFFVLKSKDLGAVALVSSLCVASTLSELLSFLAALIEYLLSGKNGKTKKSHIASVFRMAMPLALSSYVRSALLTVEHILIPKRLRSRGESDDEALSSYGMLHGMALPVLLYPMSPLSSFSSLLVPEFSEALARGERGRIKRIAKEVCEAALSYAAPIAVLIYFFSEELGLMLYSSHGAGIYIAYLAPVVPIMYLDHVTDSMLKGIGEQVYSMCVNISDSLLSVFLIWFLIPPLGIAGYGLVIIIMEAYNFTLSFIRLSKKTGVRIEIFRAFFLPLASAVISSQITHRLFKFGGTGVTVPWFILKIIFFLSAHLLFISAARLVKIIIDKREK